MPDHTDASPETFADGSPAGDPSQHLDEATLEARFDALPTPPAREGRLRFLTVRSPEGAHRAVQRARVDAETGVHGDKWDPGGRYGTGNQITVMRYDLAELFANGQPLHIFGDNLLVDLDLSEAKLPAGTRLRIGAALVEVTPAPHTGCARFKQRVGEPALRFTARPELRAQHLRGIHVRVLEGAELRVGDMISVL